MEEFAKLRQGILDQQAHLVAALARIAELEKEIAELKKPVASRTRSKKSM
jgi:cell division protein FtsB